MKRTELRTYAFEALFREFFHDEGDMEEQVKLYVDDVEPELSQEDKDAVSERVRQVLEHQTEADELISKHSAKWSISRIGHTDLTILRQAVYEMIYDDMVPGQVAINEAVVLSKKDGADDNSGSYVNGVLGGIWKFLQSQEH